MASFEPLRVRAYLRAGILSDKWLPLDGILFYQAVRDDLGPQAVTIPGGTLLAQEKGNAMRGGRLPFAYVHSKEWYYRCSWAQWSHDVEGRDYWNKRFDQAFTHLVDFRGRRGKVIIEQSTYKAYHMPIFYRSALWVEWYCVGNKERIEYLLYTVTHLGKKSSQGWGRVVSWEVKAWKNDWSIWRDGELMRGIPPEHLPKDGYPIDLHFANYGVRPSYWDKRNQITLAMPNGHE